VVDESGKIRTQWGRTIDQKMAAKLGRFVKYYTVTAKSTHALSSQLFALVWFSKL
jgi:hypothetical protein